MQDTNQPPHPANNYYKTAEEIFNDWVNIRTVGNEVAGNIISAMQAYADQQKQQIIQIIEDRIAELKKIDADFCEVRWDMSKPQFERNSYREASNETTARRHELENTLKLIK